MNCSFSNMQPVQYTNNNRILTLSKLNFFRKLISGTNKIQGNCYPMTKGYPEIHIVITTKLTFHALRLIYCIFQMTYLFLINYFQSKILMIAQVWCVTPKRNDVMVSICLNIFGYASQMSTKLIPERLSDALHLIRDVCQKFTPSKCLLALTLQVLTSGGLTSKLWQ